MYDFKYVPLLSIYLKLPLFRLTMPSYINLFGMTSVGWNFTLGEKTVKFASESLIFRGGIKEDNIRVLKRFWIGWILLTIRTYSRKG